MTYLLLFELAWKSLVTSGVALLLLALLRSRSAAQRSWIAHAGLVATLALPIVVLGLPNWDVEAPAMMPAGLVEERAAGPTIAVAPVAEASDSTPDKISRSSSAGAQAAEHPLDLGRFILWGYALPAGLLLLTMLVAVLRLFALRRRASVLVEQAWLSALAHAQRRMGFKHGTALLVSDELHSPVSWGILRPIILLNEATVAAHKEAEAIIAHELAHVARLDWAKLLVARAATALFWFNPLVWRLARQCHQLREEAADDAVLRSDVPGTDYAALLVGAARHENKAMLLAAHGVAPGRGSLEIRVRRVLDTRLSRAPAPLGWAAACCAGAALVSAPLAAITPVMIQPFAVPGLREASRGEPPLELPQIGNADPSTMAAGVAGDEAARQIGDPVAEQRDADGARESAPRPAPAVGYAQSDRLISPDLLVEMRNHGVTPDYVRALAAVGPAYARFTPEQLIALRVQGVSAADLRELAELGYPSLAHRDLVTMAMQNVTPAFVREMASLGYSGLSPDQLVTMRVQGVTPDYVREFRRAGYHRLTAEELIKLKVHGVRLNPENLIQAEAGAGPDP